MRMHGRTAWGSRDSGKMKQGNDEALFERLVAGDRECLRPLMERYGDALTLYANGYAHDVDAAEDMVIEAFSRMRAPETPTAFPDETDSQER